MRMPGIGGSQLLSEVSNRYPNVIRIVLSGMCDREAALSSVAGAHQFLAKPCDIELLKAAIERALNTQKELANGALKEFIARIVALPSLPSAYLELVEASQDPNTSAVRLGTILSRDVAMTSKILQIVNSPLFGIRRKILNPADACVFLGTDTIRSLTLSVGVFSQFRKKGRFSVEDLQAHSLQTADLAKRIAKLEQLSRDIVEECFLAGMLHDVGKLVIAVNCPAEYDACLAAAEADGRSIAETELDVFGITHADAGMYLLRLWGLSEVVTAAVALHHRPSASADRCLSALPIVHAANVLARDADGEKGLDHEYLASVGADWRLPQWRKLARKAANPSAPDSEAADPGRSGCVPANV
jgi:HD-like signal output (HDOD) protein